MPKIDWISFTVGLLALSYSVASILLGYMDFPAGKIHFEESRIIYIVGVVGFFMIGSYELYSAFRKGGKHRNGGDGE